jgi:hypothetical protein
MLAIVEGDSVERGLVARCTVLLAQIVVILREI